MFLVKKVLSQLIMPLPFIVLLIVMAWLFIDYRKFARFCLFFGVVLILLLSSPISNKLLIEPLESQFPVLDSPIAGACTVLVLGSGHNDIAQLNATQQLSSVALSRLIEGIRQFKLGSHCQLVVSGWDGGNRRRAHADVAAQAAVELGIPKSRIFRMPAAKDTIEEAEFMKELIGKQSFRLVTSATHMPRAMNTFKRLGLNPVAAPTDFINSSSRWWQLDAKQLWSSQRAIHEYAGTFWLEIKEQLTNE
ncbi:MAG: YdcF family protein [Parashewanella sp.]